MSLDYAPLTHHDWDDVGVTAALRFTESNPNQSFAYHLVHPTLQADGKQGVVFVRRMGDLTVFRAKEFLHTSTVNEGEPDPEWPTLDVAVLQKSKTLNTAKRRSDVLENIIDLDVLRKYYEMQ